VLTVVDCQAASAKGARSAAKPLPGFEQHYVETGISKPNGRTDSG
jgi:hypothetical protein